MLSGPSSWRTSVRRLVGISSSQCFACHHRLLSTSAPLYVRRPQEPYPMTEPFIDSEGKGLQPREKDSDATLEPQRLRALQELAEPRSSSWTEKYGSHNGFGLQNTTRYRMNRDGRLERWEGAGQDWRTALGVETIRRRQAEKYELANQKAMMKKLKAEAARASSLQIEPSSGFSPMETSTEGDQENHWKEEERRPQQSDNRLSPRTSNNFNARPSFGLRRFGTCSFLQDQAISSPSEKRRWQPTKKLTFSAMAGLKALHQSDPTTYNRAFLAEKFGISYEGVSRILRSNWQQRQTLDVSEARPVTSAQQEERSLAGSKWDTSPATSKDRSPVPAITKARGR